MPIPGDVGLDRVAAGLLDLPESVAPERFRAAEVMEGTAQHDEVFAVDRDALAVVADPVGTGEALGRRVGAERQAEGEQEDGIKAKHRGIMARPSRAAGPDAAW